MDGPAGIIAIAYECPAGPVLQPEFKYGVVPLRVPAENLLAFLVLPGFFLEGGRRGFHDIYRKEGGGFARIGERRVVIEHCAGIQFQFGSESERKHVLGDLVGVFGLFSVIHLDPI